MSEDIEAIFNCNQIPISLIEKYCSASDSLMIRIIKLRDIIDKAKFIEIVLKSSDSIEIFLAAIYEPLTFYSYDIKEIERLMECRDNERNILKLIIQQDEEISDNLIENIIYYLKYSSISIKKCLVDIIARTKMSNYQNTLFELIEQDFPFPKNIKNLNDERIKRILQDREIFKSDNLCKIKEYVNQNKSIRIGYDSNNKSALLYAIENKEFEVYCFLLSVGFRTDNDDELKQIIDALTEEEKDKIVDLNVYFAKSESINYLRLLISKFNVFGSRDEAERKYYFDKMFDILVELNSIGKCKPLLQFCSTLEKLQIFVDINSEHINKIHPSKKGTGLTCTNGLIFAAGNQNPSDELNKTIIHELCHYAMSQFYENSFNPYFFNDDVNIKNFEEITNEILAFVKSSKEENYCYKIISDIEKRYESDKHQSEMIVRAFEILVHFKGDENKIKKLPKCFAKLFDYVDEHVVKAISSKNIKNRAEIRDLNANIGLIQNINQAGKRLRFSENTINYAKLDKILKGSEKYYLIVSNVPMLALINIKSYLYSTQESLYDVQNVFIDPKQFEIRKKLRDFKKLQQNLSTVIVYFSCEYKKIEFSENLKIVFVTTKEIALKETHNYLNLVEIELNYKWSDLSKESQAKLVEKVNFQGKIFKLSDLIDVNFTDENLIDDKIFIDLCDENKILSINAKVDQNDIFVERKFNKIVEKKGKESDISNSKNMNQFQMVLARHKEKFNKHERIEEPFADSHNEFLTKIEHYSKILISDIAGSGKSFILQKISHELMSKCDGINNYWVLFIDLRKYLNDFHKWKNQKDFLNFFLAHFGQNLSTFEKKIFEIFYNSGKVKILLDGFDEISPKCRETIIEFIKSINLDNIPSTSNCESKKLHNQLIITTRKHLESELQEKLEMNEIFSLKSLENDEEMIEFLVAYWKTKGSPLTEANCLNDLAKQAILKFRHIKLDDCYLISKMQQLKILAEICLQNDENKIEFSINFTMYDIYERSVLQFLNNWRERPDCKDLVRKADMSSFNNFIANHQYRALLESINEESTAKFFAHSRKLWSLEEIEKGGLTTFENDKIYFIHTTYLEFFIANFMLELLENSVLFSRNLIELFCQIMFIPYLTTTQMFINDKIKSLDLTNDMIQTFCEHFNSEMTCTNIFEQSIRHNHENIFKFLLKIIENVDDDRKKLILLSEPIYPLYLSLKFSKANIFNELLRVTMECLTCDEFIKLLQKKIKSFTLVHLVGCENLTYEMMKSLMCAIEMKLGNFEQNVKNLLMFEGGKWDMLPMQMLLNSTNDQKMHKFKYFWNLNLKYMNLEELIEKSGDIDGDNILHYIAWNCDISVHKILWQRCDIEFKSNQNRLKEFLLKRNNLNMNFLHCLISTNEFSVEILELNLNEIEDMKICNIKDLLLCKGGEFEVLPLQMLLLITNSDNLNNFEYFWNYNLKHMNLEEIIEKSDDKEGDNILHYIALKSDISVQEKLWKRCEIEFKSNERKLSELLLKTDNNHGNFLQRFVDTKDSDVKLLKINLAKISKLFNNSNEMFQSKCKDGNTLLQHALIQGKSFDFFTTLWNFLKDLLDRDDFIKYIKELNAAKRNVFYVALELTEKDTNSKAQFIEFIMNSVENDLKMSQNEIKSFLKSQVNNILIHSVKYVASIEIQEYLWKVYENIFDTNEILDLINEVSSAGFNLLGIVINLNIQRNLNVVEFTWAKIKSYLKTIDEQKNHVKRCVILFDRFSNNKWLKDLLDFYKINPSTI